MNSTQQALAHAVAAQLQLSPAPAYDGHWAKVFLLTGGGKLFVSAGRQRGQLNISASLPDGLRDHRPYYRDGTAPKTSINVSETKSPEQIANDIRRRLLPEHEREVTECKARKLQHDESNAKRAQALAEVGFHFGVPVQADQRTGEPHPMTIEREGSFRLTAKPFCDRLELEIEASPAIAGRIAQMLATL